MAKVTAPFNLATASQINYIPHHAVVRDSSATTRLRVVFNASSRTSNGTSLNSHLLTGPKLQTNLIGVILRWRQYRYIISASSGPKTIRLQYRIFGYAPLPMGRPGALLGSRVFDNWSRTRGNPSLSRHAILTDHIYVDDVLFGAEDIPLLRQTRDQVCALLQRGGFQLRKWASNHSNLLADIPSDDHGLACAKILQSEESLNVLGIASLEVESGLGRRDSQSKFGSLGGNLERDILVKWDAVTRWTNRDSDAAQCELHGFADASTVAYAAVVYLRVTTPAGETTTTMLAGKSKVAPIKSMTIPRLELSAIVLLSRLIDEVRAALNLTNVSCYGWTDSTVALAWLNQHPSKWKTFVAHRVETVQSLVPYVKWNHVTTEDNPADCASRGFINADLASHTIWWNGPYWLRQDPSEWPGDLGSSSTETQLEAKSITSHVVKIEDRWDLASRYSSWTNLREEVFPNELNALRTQKPLSSRSSILALNPYLDEHGLIRVGGRLDHTTLPFRTKHPILMDAHPLVRLIVRATHLRALHAGLQLTLATIRRDFWIIRARNIIKAEIHRCVKCAREKAEVQTQLMGQLPQARVTAPTRAFIHCGVDYAGPEDTQPRPSLTPTLGSALEEDCQRLCIRIMGPPLRELMES
ncbi:PREDICTED: uncharacterized protein LOC105567609 [Vollenhovia emeryi]|uniref:uncharacterized protein LOC105567609 n=1 Tax=Vollenhovia emeryi TaxID=411798 RepID=UPI0005F51322|nr:PREDICTED: uncharacterized protein LOC105567609 [Vollenhovia emeryi]